MAKRKKKDNTDAFGFDLYEMSMKDLKTYVKKKAQSANRQLRRIEDAGIYSWAYARTMKEMASRKRFRYGFDSREKLIKELRLIEAFSSHESSKIKNLRSIQVKAYKKLRERLLKDKDIDIADLDYFDQNTFYRFLNSREGKDLIDKYGSDDVVEDIVQQMSERKLRLEDIVLDYKDFLSSELPFDVLVKIKRARTPEIASNILKMYKDSFLD